MVQKHAKALKRVNSLEKCKRSIDIKTYVSDQGQSVTDFPSLFPDGEMKPSYLLSSVSKITNRPFQKQHFDQYGLVENVDYFLVNPTDLPDGVASLNMLGNVNGKRIILSLPGVLKILTRARTELGDRISDWLYDVVVPKELHTFPSMDDHETLMELRREINRMGKEIRNQNKPLLADPFEVRVLSETVESSYSVKKIIALVVIIGTAAYFIRKKTKKEVSVQRTPYTPPTTKPDAETKTTV